MKYVLIIIGLLLTAYTSYISFSQESQTILQQTTQFNKDLYNRCFITGWSESTGSDTDRYRQSTDCWKSQRKFTPSDLYLTVPKYLVDEGKCSISQSEDEHVRAERWGMYATDIACNFKEQGVYAPDYLDDMKEYTIEDVGTDNLLWNFVILSFNDSSNAKSRWYFWHTLLDSKWKKGDTITTWVRFARADLSGATTGWHTHIELRRMYDGVWQSVRYVTRSKELKLEEKRLSQKASIPTSQSGSIDTYYFTHYDLWDEKQNDASPNIWASWVDLTNPSIKNPVAITVDIRKKLWIKFRDVITLIHTDTWKEYTATVHDEMNKRFRTWCIYRPWTSYCIKWDIAVRSWVAEIPSWPYKIKLD